MTFEDRYTLYTGLQNPHPLRQQIAREPKAFPQLKLNREAKDLFAFKYEDFVLEGYEPHPAIKAPIAV